MGISGVESAGHIGGGDQVENLFILSEFVDSEAFSKITVDV